MITFQKDKRIFSLHTKNTTYQMMADAHGVLLHLYYGRRCEGAMDYLIRLYDRGFSGNPFDAGDDRSYSLDVLPQEFPCLGTGDYRRPASVIELENGAESSDFRYDSHEILPGKYSLDGLPAVHAEESEAETLVVTLKDAWGSGLSVKLLYGVLPELDIITRAVIVKNEGGGRIFIKRMLSANVDFLCGDYDVLTFHGRHGMERVLQRETVGHGVKMIGSTRGMSSHQYNPLMILAERTATEDAGTCYAMEFLYSGGFLAEVEKDSFDQTRMQMGLMDERFRWPLEEGGSFVSPEVIMSCSTEGLSKLSHNLHRCIKCHVIRRRWRDGFHPILLNSWEGCYFQFDGNRILKMAEGAAELGLDLLVMDDGWFGKRDSDTSGLGDWQVNEEKLGCSLKDLIEKVNGLGLKFGIWMEPEMVNEDSDLYRAHPDWALQIPGRGPVRARDQLVLDFSRREVVDAIYGDIRKLLLEHHIEYVKWDYNRSIAEAFSRDAKEQGTVLHGYMLGLYDFLERLVREFPDLIIEGCSGGGGRFDAGMLYYTPQIWCSDNTDAVDRLFIQHGTSFGYPVSAVGSHVSVCPNHQNGRITPLKTRGAVAMAGTFGYELDPSKLSSKEKEEIRAQVGIYRRFAPLIAEGDYYRLSDPAASPAAAWLFVSEDRSEALFVSVNLETHFNAPVRYVKLKGLDESAFYSLEDLFGDEGGVYPGSGLCECGVPIPPEMGEYGARMYYFKRETDGTGGK